MASQLFRNLDRLAGTAGRVLYGENARQDQLLQDHLGRSQQRYLQDRKLTEQQKLQQMRLDSAQSMLGKRLGENKRQFDIREKRLSLERQGELAYSKDRLAQMGQKNQYDRDKEKEDNIKDQLKGYDDTESNLIQQGRMIAAQHKNELGVVTPEGKAILAQINEKLRDVRFEKETYAREFLPLYVKQKMDVARKEREEVKAIQEKSIYDFLKRINPTNRFNFGNTTYKTDNTVTDADKEREEFDIERYRVK